MKILHVTTHLGGGIGKILSSMVINDKKNQHIILTLQQTKTAKFYDLCIENNVTILFVEKVNVKEIIEDVDIVQFEWWHNPVTMEFFYNYFQDIKCRLVIWSHVSGCNFPYISPQFVSLPQKFIFSTNYSLNNPFWNDDDKEKIQNSTNVVVSSGVNDCCVLEKEKHSTFNIGYLGNLSYNKTFKGTVSYYEEVAKKINNVKFIIAGDTEYGKDFVSDINSSCIASVTEFSGYVNDIKTEFAKYDILSYLLNNDSFATAENALLEAMAYGVVPIVFAQCTEQYTVSHLINGLVVSNIDEYVDAVTLLHNDIALRNELSFNASSYIKENLMIDNTIANLQKIYVEVMTFDKKIHDIKDVFGESPKEWFFAAFHGDKNNITGNSAADNSSGLGQYKNYFKEFE